MTTLFWDFETFNECNLKVEGLSRYARHPSLEIVMTSWTLDQGETIKQYDRFRDGPDHPNEFLDALEDDRVTKVAWNLPFEQNVTEHALGIKIPNDVC